MVCFPFFSLFFIIIIILSLREHPPDLKTPVLKLTNESKEGEKQKKKKKRGPLGSKPHKSQRTN